MDGDGAVRNIVERYGCFSGVFDGFTSLDWFVVSLSWSRCSCSDVFDGFASPD